MLPRPEEQNPLHSLGCAQGQQQETGGSLMSCFGLLHGTMQVGILDQSTGLPTGQIPTQVWAHSDPATVQPAWTLSEQ